MRAMRSEGQWTTFAVSNFVSMPSVRATRCDGSPKNEPLTWEYIGLRERG
jgi:hypothetical protein